MNISIILLLCVVACCQATALPQRAQRFPKLQHLDNTVVDPESVDRINHENIGPSKINPKIFNGTDAAKGEAPWHVNIVFGASTACGGSIISPDWVLTSAHCVIQSTLYTLVFGSNIFEGSEPGAVIEISIEGIKHDFYSMFPSRNDIGLIRIPLPLTFTEYIQPIRLPRRSQIDETFEDWNSTATGFGSTIQGVNPYISPTMQIMHNKVMSRSFCQGSVGETEYDGSMCTFNTGGAGCRSDEGGALVVVEEDGIPTQVGVLSEYHTDCAPRKSTVYSRTTYFLDWIEEITGIEIED